MQTPIRVSELCLETTCESCTITEWYKLMSGAVQADKQKINKLLLQHLPDLYEALSLQFTNPYKYYQTKTHLILVHSAIEYFLKYKL